MDGVKAKGLKQGSIFRKIIVIIVSCAIMGLGMNLFTIPNNLAPGGLAGLATALAEVIPVLSIGALTFIGNLIVLIFALRMFGWKSLLLMLFTSVCYSGAIDLFGYLGAQNWIPTDDLLLASALGGAMIGIGVGLLFIEKLSTAGTDTITLMVGQKFPEFPSGTLMVCVDAFVVIVAVIIFGEIEIALYSFVCIFVMGRVIDAIAHGVDYAKVLLIITNKPEEIVDVLCNKQNRGVTELPAKGAFSKVNKTILLTVAHRNDASMTLKTVREIDPRAFIILYNATEVRGEGFKPLDQ